MSDGVRDGVEIVNRWPDATSWTDTVVQETYVDPLNLEQFWYQWYLDGFVSAGHGKLKCVVGRPGSGKTHFLRHLGLVASSKGFQVAHIDAGLIKIAAIEDLYRVVAQQMDWDGLLGRTLKRVIQEDLGYLEFDDAPRAFIRWGEAARQLLPNLLRRDLREAIDHHLRSVDWHPDFAMGVRSWMLEQVSEVPTGDSAAIAWLRGEKLGASQRKAVGAAANINRRNARPCLTSLASLAHLAFGQGLVLLIDNTEVMASATRTDNQPYYTRSARDQAYEMLRQLIDESPFTPYLMTIVAGDEDPLTNARTGFPSYPALWARLETEVQSTKPNLFADFVSLDRLWDADGSAADHLGMTWQKISANWWTDSAPADELGLGGLGLEWGWPRRLLVELWNRAAEKGSDA